MGFRWRARAKGFVPRRDTPLGENLPTRRTCERICPRAGTRPSAKASRHGARAKGFARAGTLSSAKASRHGARAKEFAPREKVLLGEGLPTRREGERICPAGTRPSEKASRHGARAKGFAPQEHAPRRKPPDTAHERKDLPAQERSPRRRPPDTAHGRKGLPRGSSRSPHVPTNGGPPSTDGQPEKHPSAGSHPQRAAAAEFIHRKKNKTTP